MSKRREKLQEEVLALLRRHCSQLSAYDVLGELCEANPKIAPPTICRVLADLTERGHVHRIESLNASIARRYDRHQHATCIKIDAAEALCGSCAGLTTKTHAAVDANSLPITLALAPGHQHDCLSVIDLLDSVQACGTLLVDKACDPGAIRYPAFLCFSWFNIPPSRNRRAPICFSPYLPGSQSVIAEDFGSDRGVEAETGDERPDADAVTALAGQQDSRARLSDALARATILTAGPPRDLPMA